MTAARAVTLLAGATVLGLLPFADKAFHMDDPQFLWPAQQILSHPADFYGFSINWFWTELPMAEATSNPPLTAYVMLPANNTNTSP